MRHNNIQKTHIILNIPLTVKSKFPISPEKSYLETVEVRTRTWYKSLSWIVKSSMKRDATVPTRVDT